MSIEELGSARVVRWDNQAHRNAWGRATIEEIADSVAAAAGDAAVRCVVVRGAGDDFSAGDDLYEAAEADAAGFAATIAAFQRLTEVVLAAPVPVIAAIDGVCIGGALEFAASCDLRLATERARFGTPEVRIGLAATNAGTLLLPEVLGESAARELLLTGGLRDAAWMLQHGFLNAIVPVGGLDGAVAEWAALFDQTARPAVERTKRLLNDRFGDLLSAQMARETQACVDLFETEEAVAAVKGFATRH